MFEGKKGIGLYKGSSGVWLAGLSVQSGKVRLDKIASGDLPIVTEPSAKSSGLASIIRDVFQRSGLSSKGVHVALPSRECMLRSFELPLLPEKEWAQAIRFEAQKYVPFDLKLLYSDFEATPDKERKKLQVLFICAKKEQVNSLAEILSAAGIGIGSVESAEVSWLRSFYASRPTIQKQTEALADLRSDGSFSIIIAKDQTPLMAQEGAVQGGMSSSSFADELRLLFNYFSKNFKNERIGRLVLCSDAVAEIKGWPDYLKGEFGVPVEALGRSVVSGDDRIDSFGAAVAVGLALKNVSGRKKKINLLPAGVSKEVSGALPLDPKAAEKILIQKIILVYVAVLAIVFGGIHFVFLGKINTQKQEISRIVQSYPKTMTAEPAASIDALNQKEADLSKQASFFSALFGQRIFWTDKMSALAEAIPQEAQLSLRDYMDNEDPSGRSALSLRIEGNILLQKPGSELQVANSFVSALKSKPDFMRGLDEVKIFSLQKVTSGDKSMMNFVLDCKTGKRE
jgi:Tfp pilus assembly protein PilN